MCSFDDHNMIESERLVRWARGSSMDTKLTSRSKGKDDGRGRDASSLDNHNGIELARLVQCDGR